MPYCHVCDEDINIAMDPYLSEEKGTLESPAFKGCGKIFCNKCFDEMIKKIKVEAYAEGHNDGYRKGLSEGYDNGHKDGYNEGVEVKVG